MGLNNIKWKNSLGTWDQRFLDLAQHISQWSRDPSTKVGAVIVRPDNTVASVGFNGFPQKMYDTEEYYLNRDEKYSRIIHAEINALTFCNESVKNYTIYVYPFMPCDRCFVQLVQAGMMRFVFPKTSEEHLKRWGPAFDKVKKYAEECMVELVEV